MPAFDSPSETVQLGLIKDAAARHGVRAKLSGTEIYREGLNQSPRFLLNMESYPKVSFLYQVNECNIFVQLLAGQGVNLETFVTPVGDPDMKLEWFLNKEPLLFKSSFTPVYDYGFVGLSINKVYPDDFGSLSVVVSNKFGVAEMTAWLGEHPAGGEREEEPDLPAWCNKVSKTHVTILPEMMEHIQGGEREAGRGVSAGDHEASHGY